MAEENITIKKSTYQKMMVGVVVILVAFAFTTGYIIGGSKTTGAPAAAGSVGDQPAQQAQPQPQAPAGDGRVQVSVDDDPALGDAKAKVTVIEFSDFQCPFCERLYTESEKQIEKDYVNTGKVQFVYRDFPLTQLHPEALPAALAAECANEQGKFWEYHNKLFENQQSLSDDNFKKWAADLGLNTTKFDNCYTSQKYQSEIQKDEQDGINAGVSGTPTLFVGSPAKGYQKIVGAQPYASIKQVIDQELAA